MRLRNVLSTLGSAVLIAGLLSSPASAGTGSSTECQNNTGAIEIPIISDPVTLGLELTFFPNLSHNQIVICYSTTAVGDPGVVTGGALVVDMFTNTSTAYPGAYVAIVCHPDYAFGVGPACFLVNSADFATTDVQVTTPPSTICLVSLGGGCSVYLPGVMLKTDTDPARALIQIRLLGFPIDVNPPAQCIALIVTCP